MKFFDKKIGPFKLWWFVAAWTVLLILIVVGSFADLAISKAVVNPDNFLGKTCESFGYLFGFSCLPAIGAMLFVALVKKENVWWKKALGIAIPALFIIVAIYITAGEATGDAGYSWRLPTWAGYLIASLFQILAFVGYVFLVDRSISSKELIFKSLAAFFGVFACLVLVTFVLKKIAYRPRFRAMVYDNAENGTVALGLGKYQNWWDWNFFRKPAWWDTEIAQGHITAENSELIKSWPSGHSNTASLIIILPIFMSVSLAKDKKYVHGITFSACMFYAALVAWLRIRVGAHFLTDVCWAILLTTLTVPASYYLTGLFAKNPSLEYREASIEANCEETQ